MQHCWMWTAADSAHKGAGVVSPGVGHINAAAHVSHAAGRVPTPGRGEQAQALARPGESTETHVLTLHRREP